MYDKNLSFPDIENIILKYWKRTDMFERSKDISKDREEYYFYDGPPFATGLPHYGHILSGTIKDIIGRFMFQQGFKISRRFGWDCHGLPIEYEIDKKLGITQRSEVIDMGISKYNDECRKIVMKYSGEWERTVERMGRWVDFRGGYKTMDLSFMESTWYIFKQLWDRNKIYRGYKVMPFSTACKTPLSNFEANQNYKEVSDPSVLLGFPALRMFDGAKAEFLVWTTTPWTLPANCALIMNKDIRYVLYETAEGRRFIMCEKRIDAYFKGGRIVRALNNDEIFETEYEQPYDFYENLRPRGYFRVYPGEFVTETNGTGVVHCAPAFGEDDYNIAMKVGLIEENGDAPCPVDENGCYTIGAYRGMYVKDLDKVILKDLGKKIVMNGRIVHSYPFCWRSDTPLIYRLTPNWFVRVRESREALLRNNELIRWVPETIKYRRFHNWLAQARDWAIGRNRFWGTPIPVWVSSDGETLCVGSINELEELSGVSVSDLHREHVDNIVIHKNGKEFRRCEEVLDCWFESGAMPYAQEHWPFNNKYDGNKEEKEDGCFTKNNDEGINFKKNILKKEGLPADFIGEGLDQTRGWFYTLHVLSSLLFDSPAYKNVICFGIVLAEDGKKMSKRLKNYPDPDVVFDRYGADALRLYLISSPVVSADNLRFSENGIKEILKTILIPWKNLLAFYMECGELESDKPRGEIDDWIFASFNNLCYYITESCKNYLLGGIVGRIAGFIDDLSNWYVRINRKSLRENPEILKTLLLGLSIVLAPFTPFFSEYCYLIVTDKANRKLKEGLKNNGNNINTTNIENINGTGDISMNSNNDNDNDNDSKSVKETTKLNDVSKTNNDNDSKSVKETTKPNDISKTNNDNDSKSVKETTKPNDISKTNNDNDSKSVKETTKLNDVSKTNNDNDNQLISHINPEIIDIKNIISKVQNKLETLTIEKSEIRSVHFMMYPKADKIVESDFENVKAVIDLIRQMREGMRLQLKRPLKFVEIIAGHAFREAVLRSAELIKMECNIISLAVEDTDKYEYELSIKPCFASLRNNMSTMKEKLEIIKNLNPDEIRVLATGATLTYPNTTITPNDIIIDRKFKGIPNSRTAGDFGVIFDTSIDEEIVEMKTAREFYAFLQKLRKSIGLSISDNVGVVVDNDYIQRLTTVYYPTVIFKKSDTLITVAKYRFDDDFVNVQLFRI